MSRRTGGALVTGLVLLGLTWLTLHGLLFYRPLPTIDGYYRFLGLDQRAEVVRDAFGIPRIEAGTVHDLFFLQGYVTAQDRLAQMEAMREEAAGFLPEARVALATAPAEVRAALEAYAAGVTKFIQQHAAARALPAEIALSGITPARWNAEDPMAIATANIDRGMSCVAVRGDRASNGAPLLAAEAYSSIQMPGWYEVGLSGGNVRAIGLSLPGVPGIFAGHNGRVAWAFYASPWPTDPARTVQTLLSALEASDAAALVGPEAGTSEGPIAGCVADARGAATGFTPYVQTSPDGSIAMPGPVLPNDPVFAALEGRRGLTTEDMRLGLARRWAPPEREIFSPIGLGAARIVIDLGDLDASRAVLSTGQSGHSASFHFGDQAQLWSVGQMHRLAWTPDAIARTEGRLVLRPR